MDVTICVGTYGAPEWPQMAAERALPSAQIQGVPVIHEHASTLHEARNGAAARATSEWLVFLDADDELAPGYIDALAAAEGDLRAPAVSWVTEHDATEPITLDERNIEEMNPCVIGTAIRRETFLDVGGFADWPAWEDWALFLAAYRRGAAIVHVPDAVYRAWVRPKSRNQRVENPTHLHARIRASV